MAKRARTDRREIERAVRKLGDQREKLAKLEPGGSPERPIEVASAAVIEPHARALACLRCDEPGIRVDDHEARIVEGRRLRVVATTCPKCGTRRALWFRIAESN